MYNDSRRTVKRKVLRRKVAPYVRSANIERVHDQSMELKEVLYDQLVLLNRCPLTERGFHVE